MGWAIRRFFTPRATRMKRFGEHAERVLGQIQVHIDASNGPAPRQQLQSMQDAIRHMKDLVASNQLPSRKQRHKSLTRLILDSWPFADALGRAIGDLEDEYAAL
jgi:hypothetical protein